jgi:hypothetical protein
LTGSSGFAAVSASSDTWGWSSPNVAATYAPAMASNASLSYGPAFPTGDAVLVALPLAVVVLVATYVLWRRRRRRASTGP